MNIKGIPIGDLLSIGIGLVGLLVAKIASSTRLPAWARRWLKKIGTDEILKAIELAAKIKDLTPEERRLQAVGYLQKLCEKELGFPVPTSVANLLVEYVYAQWKRTHG